MRRGLVPRLRRRRASARAATRWRRARAAPGRSAAVIARGRGRARVEDRVEPVRGATIAKPGVAGRVGDVRSRSRPTAAPSGPSVADRAEVVHRRVGLRRGRLRGRSAGAGHSRTPPHRRDRQVSPGPCARPARVTRAPRSRPGPLTAHSAPCSVASARDELLGLEAPRRHQASCREALTRRPPRTPPAGKVKVAALLARPSVQGEPRVREPARRRPRAAGGGPGWWRSRTQAAPREPSLGGSSAGCSWADSTGAPHGAERAPAQAVRT